MTTIPIPWLRPRRRGTLEGNMIGYWQNMPPDHWWYLVGIVCVLCALLGVLVAHGKAKANPAETADVLLWLNEHDAITVHQAYEGVIAVGATGSGKSSTLEHLQAALMKRGAGMLILTAGVSDFAQVSKVAKRCGREKDLIRFATDEKWRFDFTQHELCSPGGSVTTAGQLLQDLVDYSSRTSTQNASDQFWPLAAGRGGRMGITLIHRARGKCSIADLYQFMASLPSTKEQLKDEVSRNQFRETFCGKILLEVAAKGDDADASLAADWALREWPAMGEKTQGNLMAQLMNTLEKFMNGNVRELVASGQTNVSPLDLWNGKIIVVDLPILKFREAGAQVQTCWKIMTQREALRRDKPDRDVVIWADEAQLHALPSVDSMTQAVARKHRLVQVAITQSLPLLYSVLKSREDAHAWIANLQTKFIFANGDRETNDYFSALCGQSKQLLGSASVNNKPYDLVSDMFGMPQDLGNFSCGEHFLPDVRPEAFTKLRKGGKENDCIVDCYVFQGGRKFKSNGKTWVKASIKQP